MKDICNVVMGSGYLSSDGNQGNILNLGEELMREGHTKCSIEKLKCIMLC